MAFVRKLLSITIFYFAAISAFDKEQPDLNQPLIDAGATVAMWLTKSDQSVLFQRQNVNLQFQTGSNPFPTITVDDGHQYQTMDGFGCALTGGSAWLINQMPAAQQNALLRELFLWDGTNIGVSYLRMTIGASDLSLQPYSYDDMPAGQTDVNLQHFSVNSSAEEQAVILVLQKILALNPAIKILGSPWSPPPWMKINNNAYKGGNLNPQYYAVYAQYFVRYIQAFRSFGIPIDAITPQNEPLYGGNNPSMIMPATDQAIFIKNHLGPAFRAAGITTKIICYDHNCDRPDYPITVLSDPAASQYVDGSGFHLYGGVITALTYVHNAFPAKNIYFTEKAVAVNDFNNDFGLNFQWHIRQLVIGATRNWAKNVLEWNLASDAQYRPHTDSGGCSDCIGAVTIQGNSITRRTPYYNMAHASKFVRPGSVRIDSNIAGKLENVAFKTPSGDKVLIVLNDGAATQKFNIRYNGQIVLSELVPGAVATYIWN